MKMAPRITSLTRGTTVSHHVQLLQTTLNLFFRCHPRFIFIFAAFSQDLVFSQQHNGKSFHLRHQSYVLLPLQFTITIFFNRSTMSGVSVAAHPPRNDETATTAKQQQQQASLGGGGVMGSLRVIELQLVAFIMIFSASGLVPLLDLVFPALASAYFLALSRLVFPSVGKSSNSSPEIFHGSRLFRLYVIAGTTVGLFLPLAYVLGGFARGDEHAVRSATPHLFLLSFQILSENIISGLSLFSAPVRALVPMLYTVRRIFIILDWMNDVWINKTLPANADFSVRKLIAS